MSTASQKIDVPCPQCKARLAVPRSAMGKSGKCPHCGNVFPLAMPAPRQAAAALAMAASRLTPYDDSGLMPLGDSDLMPLSAADLMPLPASNNLAPLYGGNAFGDPVPQGDYTLQPMAPAPYVSTTTLPSKVSLASEHLAKAHIAYEEAKSRNKQDSLLGQGWGINAGIGGGAIMMLIAVLWFCAIVLLSSGRRFPPYALVVFVIGLIAFFRGMASHFSRD